MNKTRNWTLITAILFAATIFFGQRAPCRADELDSPSRWGIFARTGYIIAEESPARDWDQETILPTVYAVLPTYYFSQSNSFRAGIGIQFGLSHSRREHFTGSLVSTQIFAGPRLTAVWDQIMSLPVGLQVGTGFQKPLAQWSRLSTDKMSVSTREQNLNLIGSIDFGPRYRFSERLAGSFLVELGFLEEIWLFGATFSGGLELAL